MRGMVRAAHSGQRGWSPQILPAVQAARDTSSGVCGEPGRLGRAGRGSGGRGGASGGRGGAPADGGGAAGARGWKAVPRRLLRPRARGPLKASGRPQPLSAPPRAPEAPPPTAAAEVKSRAGN